MQLLKSYKPEIEAINEMFRQLREEEAAFWNEFPKIEAAMKADEVLSREAKEKWLVQYHDNMMASFRMSESLLEHYVTKNLEEFKQELKAAKGKV